MQNYLTIGKVVFVRLSFQNFKDYSRAVISSVNPLDDSENKLKYLISLDKDILDYQNLKMLLDEYSSGNCEFFFKVLYSDHVIKIKSNNKFNVNMDFLMSLKNTKGVIGIEEINEKKY